MSTAATLRAIKEAGEDFEWYPTTPRMIGAVSNYISTQADSIMDIGAGDGRVLAELAKKCDSMPDLYAIEQSEILIQAQPDNVVPVGTNFYEQNLACLPVDYIFSNPPYKEYEAWAATIIQSGHAKHAFLIIPQRWKESQRIKQAIEQRGAVATVIHTDDFTQADRKSRAKVDIVEVRYPRKHNSYTGEVKDPFDIWFDNNISTFDQVEDVVDPDTESEIERLRKLDTIPAMVEAYDAEYVRMEQNYRAIFELDYALLKELGVSKDNVRDGIKKKMEGLKIKYWRLLFEKLDTITNRLSTKTKARFLDKLTGRTSVAFTASNAYAIVLWSVKNANRYFDEQLVALFRDLSTFEGVANYKSNQRTWEKSDWRYRAEDHSHYRLDYRFVVKKWNAICTADFGQWEYPGGLHQDCHALLDDIIAVMYNLGFKLEDTPSRNREWKAGRPHEFYAAIDGSSETLFEVRAHKKGTLHFRFAPKAIKRLNVEAGRLLGWIRNVDDVVAQLGYTADEAAACFGSSLQIAPSNVKLIAFSNIQKS